MRQLLEAIGLEGRRVQMINISSAMGGQFAFAAAEFTAEIKAIGPNPLRREGGAGIDPALKAEAEAAFDSAAELKPLDPA